MSAVTLYGSLVIGGIAVLQSTVLRIIAIAGSQPDMVVVALAYIAHRNGTMTGQLCGFGAGVLLDVMGLSPLGFYALLYTLLGALFGATRGKMFVDPVVMPMLFAIVAVVLKGLLAVLLSGIFGIEGVVPRVISLAYLIELGYTALFGPVLFGLLGLFSWLKPDRRRGEMI